MSDARQKHFQCNILRFIWKYRKKFLSLQADIKTESMCTVTLSFNEKDKVASEKLAALLSTGLFVQLNRQEDLDVDYADPTLYEDSVPIPEEKDYYSPEELREILISDLNEIYGVKDAV